MRSKSEGIVVLVGWVVSGLLVLMGLSCSLGPRQGDVIDGRSAGTDEQQAAKAPEDASESSDYYDAGSGGEVANPFCIACHADFDEEKLALNHELAGIGCERCHGESERHRSDENNATAPDIMWPRDRINPMCMMCHPRWQIEHVTHHRSILEGAQTIFDEQAGSASRSEERCTDCHGRSHRMKVRTIRWNRATGGLIEG